MSDTIPIPPAPASGIYVQMPDTSHADLLRFLVRKNYQQLSTQNGTYYKLYSTIIKTPEELVKEFKETI